MIVKLKNTSVQQLEAEIQRRKLTGILSITKMVEILAAETVKTESNGIKPTRPLVDKSKTLSERREILRVQQLAVF